MPEVSQPAAPGLPRAPRKPRPGAGARPLPGESEFPGFPSPTLALRGEAALGTLVAFDIRVLPVAAVLLLALAARPPVVAAAGLILTVAAGAPASLARTVTRTPEAP